MALTVENDPMQEDGDEELQEVQIQKQREQKRTTRRKQISSHGPTRVGGNTCKKLNKKKHQCPNKKF